MLNTVSCCGYIPRSHAITFFALCLSYILASESARAVSTTTDCLRSKTEQERTPTAVSHTAPTTVRNCSWVALLCAEAE